MPASWWGRRAQMERARPSRCLRRPPCPPRSALEPHRPAGSSGSPEPLGPQLPEGPLDIAPRAFALLVTGPGVLAFDGRGIPGLPARHLRLGELRRLMLAHGSSEAAHDRVWAHLRGRARREGGAWVLACAGIAMPGLKARAAALACGWVGDPVDLDRELLTGFLEGVRAWGGREVAPLLQPCLGDRPSARVSPGARPGSPVTLPAPGASCWLRLAESATATAISWPTEPLLGMGTPNAGRQPRPGPAPVTPSSTRAARRTSCARRCA